jgi:hypothetical protein
VKVQSDVCLGFAAFGNPNENRSSFREFKGVANQVGQDLPQSPRIPAEPGWQVRLDFDGQPDAFGLGVFSEQLQRAFDRLNQIKIAQVKFQLCCFFLVKSGCH